MLPLGRRGPPAPVPDPARHARADDEHEAGMTDDITSEGTNPDDVAVPVGPAEPVRTAPGPRPLRTVQVYDWLQEIPQWAGRHQVRPGLSGLAQVVGSYYYPALQKLRYDRIYIRHISLAFDLKLLFLAFMVVFYLRWHADWDGHIPRRWLRWGTRPSVRLEARPAEVAAE